MKQQKSIYTKDALAEFIARYDFEVGDYTYGVPTIKWWGEKAKLKIGRFCSIAGGINIFLGGNHRTDWITTYPFSAYPVNQAWPEAVDITGHPSTKGDVVIGNDVWLGEESVILSGISIGDGAVVATRGVVTKDIPPYTIFAGNPAKRIGQRFSDHDIDRLLKLQWWNWDTEKIKQNLCYLCSGDIEGLWDSVFQEPYQVSKKLLDDLHATSHKKESLTAAAKESNLSGPVRNAITDNHLIRINGDHLDWQTESAEKVIQSYGEIEEIDPGKGNECRNYAKMLPIQSRPVTVIGAQPHTSGKENIGLNVDNKINPDVQHQKMGKLLEAKANYQRALRRNPESANAYQELGNVYRALGELEQAVNCYERALAIKPDFMSVHLSLAKLRMPGEDYLCMLKHFHDWLKPESYVEIGVESGKSLFLSQAGTVTIGIDPEPKVSKVLASFSKIYPVTSNTFFRTYDLSRELGKPAFELAFIDGLHLFEQALRDFINLERYAMTNSIILLHDSLPLDGMTSSRTRTTSFWSGDTWKVVMCLKAYRPDLTVFTIAAPPTGLCVITKLDSASTFLEDNFDQLITEFVNLNYDDIKKKRDILLNVMPNHWPAVRERFERIRGRNA